MDAYVKQLVGEVLHVQGKRGIITMPRAGGKEEEVGGGERAAVSSMAVEELVDIADDDDKRGVQQRHRLNNKAFLGVSRVAHR